MSHDADRGGSGASSTDVIGGPAPADAVETLLDAAETGERGDALAVTRHHDGYTVRVTVDDVERPMGRDGGGRRRITRGRLTRGEAADRLRQHPAHVTNWRYWSEVGSHGTARRAFLRWLEGVDDRHGEASGDPSGRHDALAGGVTREWGQLLVTVSLIGDGSGRRRYALRHVRDRGADPSTLEKYERPRAARELGTTDERGRYRPLRTAPTLRPGWHFPDLDGEGLVSAVEFFYPATVANWHRERQGTLDVTHYRETAERQTGIYGMIADLEPENVEHLAATCCDDSQCLRRREWDEDAETPLDAPRGDGPFPCREPCSLVVAAARTFTAHQGEEPREYTFELTPTEKNQLEGILDAVADGRIDAIREADLNDPANRYRARFLREKRLTDDGLSGVPTFEHGDED